MKNKKIIITIAIIGIVVIFSFIRNFKKDKNSESVILNEVFVPSTQKVEETNLVPEIIKVHIVGEVTNPGLIELEVGSRIQDAVELAGGLTQEADTSKTNLAYILSDGEKIKIPSIYDEEIEEYTIFSNSKVNINTATAKELQTIPGVGESTANSIVEYRTNTGKFASIEEIQNVSGIGESKFEKMKDYISVK